MDSRRSMWPMALIVVAVLSLVAGACSDDGDGGTDTVAGVVEPSDGSDEPADGAADQAGAGDSSASSGGAPVGTATIDGTEYTIDASLQCLVALEQANQISISGDVEEYESDEPYEWQYSWDSDDGINEFSIQVGDEFDDEYWAFGTFSDPQVSGESVTASGTVTRGADTLEATFEIDCSS